MKTLFGEIAEERFIFGPTSQTSNTPATHHLPHSGHAKQQATKRLKEPFFLKYYLIYILTLNIYIL